MLFYLNSNVLAKFTGKLIATVIAFIQISALDTIFSKCYTKGLSNIHESLHYAALVCLSITLSTLLQFNFLKRIRGYYNNGIYRYICSSSAFLIITILVTAVIAGTYSTCSKSLASINAIYAGVRDPLVAFLDLALSRIGITIYMVLISLVFLSTPALLLLVNKGSNESRKMEKLRLNIRRKTFHIMAFVFFTSAYIFEPYFLKVAFMLAFSGMFLVETYRAFRIWPIMDHLDYYIYRFLTSRDNEKAVMSHISLLLACAIPVWLQETQNKISGLSGMISIGASDSTASIFGILFGKTKWPLREKTVLGTIIYIITIIATNLLLNEVYSIFKSPPSDLKLEFIWPGIIFSGVLQGFLEASISGDDNIVISLYAYSTTVLFSQG